MSHKSEEGNETSQQSTGRPGTGGTKSQGAGRFLIGAASGVAFAVLAPLFSKQLRPVVKGAVKGGIATGRYVQKVAEGVVEDFQDIAAEAKAELSQDETAKAAETHNV